MLPRYFEDKDKRSKLWDEVTPAATKCFRMFIDEKRTLCSNYCFIDPCSQPDGDHVPRKVTYDATIVRVTGK